MAERRAATIGDIIWLDDKTATKFGHRLVEVVDIDGTGVHVCGGAYQDEGDRQVVANVEHVIVGKVDKLLAPRHAAVNWERRKLTKEMLGHFDNFSAVESGGDVEAIAERLGQLLDLYISRSTQGWVR